MSSYSTFPTKYEEGKNNQDVDQEKTQDDNDVDDDTMNICSMNIDDNHDNNHDNDNKNNDNDNNDKDHLYINENVETTSIRSPLVFTEETLTSEISTTSTTTTNNINTNTNTGVIPPLEQNTSSQSSSQSSSQYPSSQPPQPSPSQILLIKFVFYMLGIGFLLPWNAFISAESYFLSRFIKSTCDSNSYSSYSSYSYYGEGVRVGDSNADNNGNDDGDDDDNADGNFMSWLGLLYNLSGVFVLALLLVKQRFKEIKQQRQQNQQREEEGAQQQMEIVEGGAELEAEMTPFNESNKMQSNISTRTTTTASSTTTTTATTTTLAVTTNEQALNQNNNNNNNTNNQNQNETRNQNNPKTYEWITIIASLSTFLFIITLTSIFVLIPTFNNNKNTIQSFKNITFTCIIICGISGAFTSSSIISYANIQHFPPLYSIQCYISGQAMGGVVISVLNLVLDYVLDGKNEDIFWNDHCGNVDADIITTATAARDVVSNTAHTSNTSAASTSRMISSSSLISSSSSASCHEYNIDWGAFTYFTICSIFLILCIMLYIYLDAHPITEYYRHCKNNENTSGIDTNANASRRNSTMHTHDVGENDNNNDNDDNNDDAVTCLVVNGDHDRRRHTNEMENRLNGISSSSSNNVENLQISTNTLWMEQEAASKENNDVDDYDDEEQPIKERVTNTYSSLMEPLLNDEQQHETESEIKNEQEDRTHIEGNNTNDNNNDITRNVWTKIQSPTKCILVTFCITLTIFPSWTGKMESAIQCHDGSSRFRNDLFIPLTIVLFNIFDLAGRMSSGFVMTHLLSNRNTTSATTTATRDDVNDNDNNNSLRKPELIISKKITFLSTLRILFLPAFLLCKTNDSSIDLFETDFYPFILMVLFAFSNGLVSTLSFIHAATLMPSNSEKNNDAMQRVASTLLNFAVGIGLILGSSFSFVYNYIGIKL